MTWLVEQKRTWAEWVALRVLQVGPIPKHVAIIMDGNRRYARKEHKETLDGHTQGFHKLTEVLSWGLDIGIKEVTVYAFSIENFKRSKQEVDGLMKLAAQKFAMLWNTYEQEKMKEYGVCIRVIGNLDLLPAHVRMGISKAMLATKNNKRCYLNLAMAYTSREEITNAITEMSCGVEEKQILQTDVSELLLDSCLYTAGMQDPELYVRTSGEVRLSDFLLWQSGFSCMFFTKVLWPEFTIWHMFGAIFYFQRHFHTLSKAKCESEAQRQLAVEESDIECCHVLYGEKVTQEQIASYAAARKRRIEIFLHDLKDRRWEYLKINMHCVVFNVYLKQICK
ncbi:unnamed protein product, partial [Meganyctiphanes norvegica]